MHEELCIRRGSFGANKFLSRTFPVKRMKMQKKRNGNISSVSTDFKTPVISDVVSRANNTQYTVLIAETEKKTTKTHTEYCVGKREERIKHRKKKTECMFV